MIITTTNTVEKYTIEQYLGIVNANIVIGTNLFSDIAASLTDVFGGRSGTYQNKLNLIYNQVVKELESKARVLNADAILGLHIDFDEISGGGESMFMISASGTAVLLKFDYEDRYTIYKKLSDLHDYLGKGFLTEEEYIYEKQKIIEHYSNPISQEIVHKKTIEQQKIEELQEMNKQKERERNEALEKLIQKLQILKKRGFIEQAVQEYQKFALIDKKSAEKYICELSIE